MHLQPPASAEHSPATRSEEGGEGMSGTICIEQTFVTEEGPLLYMALYSASNFTDKRPILRLQLATAGVDVIVRCPLPKGALPFLKRMAAHLEGEEL